MPRRKLVAGNWKMNGLTAAVAEFDRIVQGAPEALCDLMICPPFTLISTLAHRAAGSDVQIGGQDCHAKSAGAHTGDISAEMLADAGAKAVILGHSERRADHDETSDEIAAKVEAAWRASLLPVICVGETEAERDAGDALEVIEGQLSRSLPEAMTPGGAVIAYEPVWAIGTGRVPTLEQIGEAHGFMRRILRERFGDPISLGARLLYGGSVKPDNARAIFSVEDVDGALVGGASLKAADFLAIAAAA